MLDKIIPSLALVPLLLAGCDAPNPGAELTPRDGESVQFKTQSTDLSFKWRGCEPPWGPDPYKPEAAPSEKWLEAVGSRIAIDAPAHALASARESGLDKACDAGCADLDMGWSGTVSMGEGRHAIKDVQALGWCDEKSAAWSIDVAIDASFQCACE
ncbi:MAG: hypothetical protein U0168_02120 [Nannocystaceae bacterium]|jgi:hypothetical protein